MVAYRVVLVDNGQNHGDKGCSDSKLILTRSAMGQKGSYIIQSRRDLTYVESFD